MKSWKRFVLRVLLGWYGLLLRLYPASFREKFGEEMATVFAQALAEARRSGPGTLFCTGLRELGSLPLAAIAQWWSRLGTLVWGQERMMGDSNSTGRSDLTWSGTLLAALPHLLAAIIAWWAYPSPARLEFLLEVALTPVVAVMLGIAWWRSWPRWSGSWAGYAVGLSFFILLNRLTPLLESTLGVERILAVPEMSLWLPDTAIWLLWLLAALGGLFLLAGRDPVTGLLTLLPLQPVLLNYLASDSGDLLLLMRLALVAAAVAVALYRTRRVYLALALVFALNLVVALPGSYLSLLEAPLAAQLTSAEVLRALGGSLIIYMWWLAPPLLLVLWQALRQQGRLKSAAE